MVKNEFPLLPDAEKVISVLNKITIFGGLTQKQLFGIFKLLKQVSYSKGELIFEQGSPSSHIYIILSGKVKIFVSEGEISLELIQFKVGESFGETSMIGIQSHSASAIALEDTELIVLSRESLLSIFETEKKLFGILILNIAREACRRLHKTDEVLLHYMHKK